MSKISSMTGFARSQGTVGTASWVWELRSVNGRGLDVKLRVGAGLDALEIPLREAVVKVIKRGNVSGTLTVKREAASGLTADPVALERIKILAIELADSIPGALPPRAELLLGLPGVMRQMNAADEPEEAQAALSDAVKTGFSAALEGLVAEAVGVGRKLDFLMQEFNREVNTLCSKSASLALTGIGLNMKAVVEQLREQVQNIE